MGSPDNNNSSVSIIGTGDFSRTFSKKLASHGFKVVVGSRFPRDRNFVSRDSSFKDLDVTITTIDDCIQASDVIFLAVHADHMRSLTKYKSALGSKVLVDVTNTEVGNSLSNAETVAQAFGNNQVVKAFNTISAYELELEDGISSDRKVYISGDDRDANMKVEDIARNAGFSPMMFGGLQNAGKIEEMQRSLWHGWGAPVVVSGVQFIGWGVYGTLRYQIWKGNPWSMWPINTMNKVFACTAMSTLAMCYIPGCVAGMAQIAAGTKHITFPSWLDKWLKMRKQLGLISLAMAGTHMVMSVAHLSAPYFPNWYEPTQMVVPANHSAPITIPMGVKMNLWGETVISLGGVALGIMTVLGITSIPSVGSSMNWMQWNFVHTNLGYTCLATAFTHVLLKGLPDWPNKEFKATAKGMAFLSLVLPAVALFSKSLLAMPGVSGYLAKIRKGWERGRGKDV